MDAEFRNELREANDRNWDRFEAKLEAMGSKLTGEFKSGLSDLRVEMHQEFTKHLRWTFGFWVMTVLTIAGLKFL